jgi:hypothetical protein
VSGYIDQYKFSGKDGMVEISSALAEGMTPVVSYWSSRGMAWLDGKRGQGDGVCKAEHPSQCAAKVQVSNFAVEMGTTATAMANTPSPVPTPAPAPAPAPFATSGGSSDVVIVGQAATGQEIGEGWMSFSGVDAFTGEDVHRMPAGDVAACLQYARTHGLGCFVIWHDTAFFRQQSGEQCHGALFLSSEATTYLTETPPQVQEWPASPAPQIQTASEQWPAPQLQSAQATDEYSAWKIGDADDVAAKMAEMQAAAKAGWTVVHNRDTGDIYYYNKVTRQTAWTPPA